MTLPVIETRLRLPYPVTLDLGPNYGTHTGELVSVADDGTERVYIIRLQQQGSDLVITMPAGDHKIETAYDEHGVKWARAIGGSDD